MGEPCECEQEAANSVATAGCMNRMVERAEPTVVDVDVNGMALLGREPAERASGVDEGDRMEREPQMRLPKTELFCEETRQRNGNAEDNIPIANRLPLEGEWTVYPSSEMKNSNGGNAGREVEPTDMPNKSEMLITVLIESEDPHSGETPRVYLGGMQMRADDTNGLGCRTDGSRSQADGPGGLTDAPSASNKAETDVISHGDGMNTYLGAGDTKCTIDATDGVETHADVSTRQGEVPSVESDASSVETDTRTAVNVRRDVVTISPFH